MPVTDLARKLRWGKYHAEFHIRFWDRIDRSAGPDQCWPYLGSTRSNGYGRLRLRGKYEMPHRLAYRFSVGEVPKGMFVCHHCDNPPCCNPAHLFLGTHADNMADRNKKGRYRLPEVLRARNAALKAQETDHD